MPHAAKGPQQDGELRRDPGKAMAARGEQRPSTEPTAGPTGIA
ncbi:hypothetical protein [Streptomyces caniferus]